MAASSRGLVPSSLNILLVCGILSISSRPSDARVIDLHSTNPGSRGSLLPPGSLVTPQEEACLLSPRGCVRELDLSVPTQSMCIGLTLWRLIQHILGSSDRKTLSPDYIELADKDNKGDASVVTVHVLTSPRDSLLQQATRRSPPPMMLDSLGPSCAYQAKDHEPTAKEKALAEAARARLYGGKVKSVEEKPKLPSGPEPAAVEVTYLERSQVASAEGPEKPVEVLLEGCLACGLPSKEWTESVAALNQLRQFSVHHSSILQPRLDQAMPLVLKHIKSLRSSVCKTALLCLSDLFVDFGDRLIPLLDVGGMERPATSMLCQLLLKASSNDKKFVIEEAERCLGGMCKHLSPAPLLPLVLPYIQHRVPMVRGNAGACVATVISQSVSSGSDLASHLRTAGRLVTDKTPMAREAARSIIASVHREWDRQHPGDDSLAWESFCRSELSASCAAAVLKAAM